MVQKVNQLFELGVSIVIFCLLSLLWGCYLLWAQKLYIRMSGALILCCAKGLLLGSVGIPAKALHCANIFHVYKVTRAAC